MDTFKSKLILYTISYGLVISSCIGLLLFYFFPLAISSNWYLAIALYFLIVEIATMLYVYSSSKNKSKKQMVNVYMLAKVVKILVSLALVATYTFNNKENIKEFVIIFILFYLLYLAIETSLFIKIEKHLKEKISQNE